MELTAGKKQKIGLLGGTFDPVHNGHLAVADHALLKMGLDYVWFIPAARPPHKDGHADGFQVSDFAHRLTMLRKATSGNNLFYVTDVEAERHEPSYSIDTVRILRQCTGPEAEFFFIIGADAFAEINTWKQYKLLPSLINFVIISRPTFSADAIGRTIGSCFPGYKSDPAKGIWTSPENRGRFIYSSMTPVAISSTDIRQKVNRGQDVGGLVPPEVGDYIRREALYLS